MKLNNFKVHFLFAMFAFTLGECSKPNIIFILVDDMGYGQVGYHNHDFKTPNIDKLAAKGIILEGNYVQPTCTPSRSALMTGMYPYHIGRQNWVITPDMPTGLTLNRTLLPEVLKNYGYQTHLVGKWHLGHCNQAYLPTQRGFDTTYGYWEGAEDYYTKIRDFRKDFKENDEPVRNEAAFDTYSSYLYTDRMNSLLNRHAEKKAKDPFFIYLATQSIHDPFQAPKEYMAMYDDLEEVSETKKTIMAMATALDDIVGNVTATLKATGLYENTLIIFSSDNGAAWGTGGSFPLRGFKASIFEGGTRVPGFIHSPLLPKSGYVSREMIHITDWFPTLVRIASDSKQPGLATDGVDQYDFLFCHEEPCKSARNEFVYNIEQNHNFGTLEGAIRHGDWKFIREVSGDNQVSTSLYNIAEDEFEAIDLSQEHPDVLGKMKSEFDELAKSMVPYDGPYPIEDERQVDEDGNAATGWCEV